MAIGVLMEENAVDPEVFRSLSVSSRRSFETVDIKWPTVVRRPFLSRIFGTPQVIVTTREGAPVQDYEVRIGYYTSRKQVTLRPRKNGCVELSEDDLTAASGLAIEFSEGTQLSLTMRSTWKESLHIWKPEMR